MMNPVPEQDEDAGSGSGSGSLTAGEQLRYLQFYKTSPCRYFQRGACNQGAACSFAHGRSELRKRPDLTKTSICENWLKGLCHLSADDCGFAHGDEDRRVTSLFYKTMLCRMHHNKGRPCPNGDRCCHAHSMQELTDAWQRQVESGVVASVEAGTALQSTGQVVTATKVRSASMPDPVMRADLTGSPSAYLPDPQALSMATLGLDRPEDTIQSSTTLLQLLALNAQLLQLQQVGQLSQLKSLVSLLERSAAQRPVVPRLPAGQEGPAPCAPPLFTPFHL